MADRIANSKQDNNGLSDFKHNDNTAIDRNEDKTVPYKTILSSKIP